MSTRSTTTFCWTTVSVLGAFALAACGSDGGDGGEPDAIVIGDTGTGDVAPDIDSSDTTPDADTADDVIDVAPDGTPTPELRPCEVNADCRGGEICRDDFCRTPCEGDTDCETPGLETCGERDYCVQCGEAADCTASETCADGFCAFFCSSDDHCPAGTACNTDDGTCFDVECRTATDCGDDEVCIDYACVPATELVCTPATAFCEGNTLVSCSDDGTSESRRACSDAAPCTEREGGTAACIPVDCEPDAIGCLDLATAYLCEGGGSYIEAPCRSNQICVDGVCLVPECTPGTTVCEGDTVIACDGDGSIVDQRVCAEQIECITSPGGCVCEEGTCVTLACRPGTGRCVGNAAQRCADDGRAYLPATDCGDEFCVLGECSERVCEPSTTTCVGETVVACNADGTDAVYTDCAASSRLCTAAGESASCTDRVCTPSTSVCAASGLARQVCDARGATLTEVACGDGQYCDGGACVEQVCVPGSAPLCAGNDVVQCDALGSGLLTLANCGASGCEGGECADPCAAATGTLGCEFWAVDLDNYRYTCTTDADCGTGLTCTSGLCSDSAWLAPIVLAVTNPGDTAVDVEIFNRTGTRLQTARIAARGSLSLTLPNGTLNDTMIGEAWRLTSTLPVGVVQHNPSSGASYRSNDTSTLLPTRELGTTYTVLGWPSTSSLRSSFTVVATAAGGTDITMTLAGATAAAASGTPGAFSAGRTTTLRLFQGQALNIMSASTDGTDLTGTTITATQPVAVFSSHECANVPAGVSFCDHIEEQLPPTTRWGRSYVLARSQPRGTEPDLYRVLAGADGTRVTMNPPIGGVDGQTINRGEWLEFFAAEDVALSATADVLVGHFLVGTEIASDGGSCDRFFGIGECAIARSDACGGTRSLGDPGFAILAPTTAGRTRFAVRILGDAIENHVTLVAPAVATVTVDGATPTGTPVSVGTFRVYRFPLGAGTRRIESTAPATGIVYQYGCGFSTLTSLGY